MEKTSLAYHLIKLVGLNIPVTDYGNISLLKAAKRALKGIFNAILLKYCMYSVLLSPLNYHLIRPLLWRWIGAKVGKNTFIGYEVWMDFTNATLIELGDQVHIANRCTLLCHKRNIHNYFSEDDYNDLQYHRLKIHLKKACSIGMGSIIMPGVTIGEGAIIGAGSLVTKDIPAWTVAWGSPAKVMRQIPKRI